MKDFPVIKITIAFITGILLFPAVKINLLLVVILSSITIILFAYSSTQKVFNKYSSVLSLFLIVIIIGIGNILAELNTRHFNSTISELYLEKNVVITGKIRQIELKRESEIIFYVDAEKFSYQDTTIYDQITVLCKLRVDSKDLEKFYEKVKPGNDINFACSYLKARNKRNPGEFDYDKYLKSKGITGIVTIKEASDYQITANSYNIFENVIFQARKFVDEKINLLHSKKTSALLRGLLLADRREINEETKTQFINSGVIHVLAVSGLHVGFIAFIFFFLFGRLNIYLRSGLTIAGLLVFMFITGIPPSVFRATIMAIVIIVAFFTNRSTNIFNSLAIAALIILVIDPAEIYSPGFQLSFSAVLAIGIFYPPLSQTIYKLQIKNKIINYLLLFMCVSIAAQIGTLPFVLIYFGKISVIGLFVNLIVIPAIGLIISLALTSILFSVLLPFIAGYYSSTNDFVTMSLLKIIEYSGNLSFSKIDVINYSLYDAIIFYVCIIILFAALKRFQNSTPKVVLVILIIVNLLLFSSFDDRKIFPDNELSVFMIDVGQGDAFLIKFPNNKTALVDAGNVSAAFDNGEKIILPLLHYLGIDEIDYGFISHIDLDHYGGFFALTEADKIKEIYKPSPDTSNSKDTAFEKYLKSKHRKIHYYNKQSLKIGNCMLYVLNDSYGTERFNLSSNDKSGILKIVYGQTSFLFIGDAGTKIEKILVNKFAGFLDSDVLKVGHHGSKTSTSDEFVNYTSPEFALISAGIKNSFGHPSDEVLLKLIRNEVKLLRTDKSGGILVISDGYHIHTKDWN